MAGGRSERMRATLGPGHKALVPILGVPMIERNLFQLLSLGFREIVVAGSVHEPSIKAYVESRGDQIAEAVGGNLSYHAETLPLGTIGATGVFARRMGPLLVVNVDNLTTLDLRLLVDHHQRTDASLTIATHQEPFQIPFGEVVVVDGQVSEYLEKPIKNIKLSSGTYVLSGKTCDLIETGKRTDVTHLFRMLKERSERISAFEHEAPWIDVNDGPSVEKAERLIIEKRADFEYWAREPDRYVATLIVRSPSGTLLNQNTDQASRYRGLLDLPGVEFRPQETTPEEALRQSPLREVWFPSSGPAFVTSFDDLDTTTGLLLRHYVFNVRFEVQHPSLPSKSVFHRTATSHERDGLSLSSSAIRSLDSHKRCMLDSDRGDVVIQSVPQGNAVRAVEKREK